MANDEFKLKGVRSFPHFHWLGNGTGHGSFWFPTTSRPVFNMSILMLLPSLAILCNAVAFAQASVTIYHQIAFGFTATPTGSNPPAATTLAAYNNTRLVPPPIPSPPPPNAFTLTLPQNAAAVNGLSIPHVGPSFWGFSIEMSVISQVHKFFFNSYFFHPFFLSPF
jgi:hypothetical protein